jgi:hypothetical protein
MRRCIRGESVVLQLTLLIIFVASFHVSEATKTSFTFLQRIDRGRELPVRHHADIARTVNLRGGEAAGKGTSKMTASKKDLTKNKSKNVNFLIRCLFLSYYGSLGSIMPYLPVWVSLQASNKSFPNRTAAHSSRFFHSVRFHWPWWQDYWSTRCCQACYNLFGRTTLGPHFRSNTKTLLDSPSYIYSLAIVSVARGSSQRCPIHYVHGLCNRSVQCTSQILDGFDGA